MSGVTKIVDPFQGRPQFIEVRPPLAVTTTKVCHIGASSVLAVVAVACVVALTGACSFLMTAAAAGALCVIIIWTTAAIVYECNTKEAAYQDALRQEQRYLQALHVEEQQRKEAEYDDQLRAYQTQLRECQQACEAGREVQLPQAPQHPNLLLQIQHQREWARQERAQLQPSADVQARQQGPYDLALRKHLRELDDCQACVLKYQRLVAPPLCHSKLQADCWANGCKTQVIQTPQSGESRLTFGVMGQDGDHAKYYSFSQYLARCVEGGSPERLPRPVFWRPGRGFQVDPKRIEMQCMSLDGSSDQYQLRTISFDDYFKKEHLDAHLQRVREAQQQRNASVRLPSSPAPVGASQATMQAYIARCLAHVQREMEQRVSAP